MSNASDLHSEVQFKISAPTVPIITESSHGFLQSLQVNARMALQIRL